MPPHPPDEHNEPTNDAERSRAYLRGFDDAQNAADPPENVGMPEDVVIDDIDGRQLIVSPTAEGVIVRDTTRRSAPRTSSRLAHELLPSGS